MKQFWVDIRPWNKEVATTAIESGADALVVDKAEDVKRLGRIRTIAPDGDMKIGTDVAEITITDKASENRAAGLGKHTPVIVTTSDWTVIPLENLVAQSDHIIARVKNVAEAEMAIHVLEKGVYGILLSTTDPATVKAVAAILKSTTGKVGLVPFTVTKIQAVGMGDRVCVDTASMMTPGEGMLIGSQAKGFFLVHSESEDSPYVAARPFRVNAGAVHAYIRVGEKTRYLSELKSGDEVTIVSKDGLARSAIVGRSKIEKRPMILIEAEAKGERISTLLQNAETIKLVGADGIPRPVTELKAGDEVLVHLEETARHFGMKIEESIVEK